MKWCSTSLQCLLERIQTIQSSLYHKDRDLHHFQQDIPQDLNALYKRQYVKQFDQSINQIIIEMKVDSSAYPILFINSL
jgi:hypothetical protein